MEIKAMPMKNPVHPGIIIKNDCMDALKQKTQINQDTICYYHPVYKWVLISNMTSNAGQTLKKFHCDQNNYE
jgi:hypothetical protein